MLRSAPNISKIYSSGVNLIASNLSSSSFALVVFPDPGRPTVKNSLGFVNIVYIY